MGEKECEDKIEYVAKLGTTFNLYYSDRKRFSQSIVNKIDDFIDYFEENGLQDWRGKVSPSDHVPLNYKDRDLIIQKARKYNLWHAHIGIPLWKNTSHGRYEVSEWVVHFKKINDFKIILLELDSHNPMTLPSDKILNEK